MGFSKYILFETDQSPSYKAIFETENLFGEEFSVTLGGRLIYLVGTARGFLEHHSLKRIRDIVWQFDFEISFYSENLAEENPEWFGEGISFDNEIWSYPKRPRDWCSNYEWLKEIQDNLLIDWLSFDLPDETWSVIYASLALAELAEAHPLLHIENQSAYIESLEHLVDATLMIGEAKALVTSKKIAEIEVIKAAKAKALKAANAKHAPKREIKKKALQIALEMKQQNPDVPKSQIAESIIDKLGGHPDFKLWIYASDHNDQITTISKYLKTYLPKSVSKSR